MWNVDIAAANAREIAAVLAPMVTAHSDKLFSVVYWYWGLNQILITKRVT